MVVTGSWPLMHQVAVGKNYEPNSFGGPVQTDAEYYKGVSVTVARVTILSNSGLGDDFKQAETSIDSSLPMHNKDLWTILFRSLAQVSRQDIIDRSIGHFSKADTDFGKRIKEGSRNKTTFSRLPNCNTLIITFFTFLTFFCSNVQGKRSLAQHAHRPQTEHYAIMHLF